MDFKPSIYDEAARCLSNSVKQVENPLGEIPEYKESFVKMNIVHARQDIVLLVSYLSSLNTQAKYITYLLMGILIGIIALVFK